MRQRTLGLLAIGLLALALLLGSASVAAARSAAGFTHSTTGPQQGGYGMMGQGGMMGAGGGAPTAASPDDARALTQRLAAGAVIDRQSNTVTYHKTDVELVALGSPEGQKDMTWNVEGLVNPTVVVPRGAQVTVHFFDADEGTPHGWGLTTTPPPYPYMTMMDVAVAFPGAFAMPVSGATAQRWFGRTVQFTASTPGTYYYLCPVPGHAQRRMYGTFQVKTASAPPARRPT